MKTINPALALLGQANRNNRTYRPQSYQQASAPTPVASQVNSDSVLGPLLARFETARSKGIKTPKIRLDTFVFSAAAPTSANPGAIYVKENGAYLGKIVRGTYLPLPEVVEDQYRRILTVMEKPDEAAKEYGRRTGNCCVCGRLLTNEDSIEAMIGPICAGNYGF